MRRRRSPVLLLPGGVPRFPDPSEADDEGLVAIGGDLSVERLLLAYESGIFPWYDQGLPPLWWSPDPRGVIEPHRLHVSRSLRRELRKAKFEVTFDRAFERVMRDCAGLRDGGTWILPEMIESYARLHTLGHAHSFEVWQGDELVGGLYGVQRGALFAAESMFHRATNASKVAFVRSVECLFACGVELYDVQFWTEHLGSLGVSEIPRREYLAHVHRAARKPVSLEPVSRLLERGPTEPRRAFH